MHSVRGIPAPVPQALVLGPDCSVPGLTPNLLPFYHLHLHVGLSSVSPQAVVTVGLGVYAPPTPTPFPEVIYWVHGPRPGDAERREGASDIHLQGCVVGDRQEAWALS